MTTTVATAVHAVGETGIPRGVAPVAAVVHVAGESNTPRGAVSATEGAGPTTTKNGAGEQGSPHATAYGTRGRDFTTLEAASATRRVHPAKMKAAHTFCDADAANTTQRNHRTYTRNGHRQEQERTGGIRWDDHDIGRASTLPRQDAGRAGTLRG